MPVFTPPDHARYAGPKTQPIIFLAGPIQGAADWQKEAIALLQLQEPDVIIASPRSRMWSRDLSPEESARLYKIQNVWEHDHLDAALSLGCILFWLDQEEVHIARRAFAQTSRLEQGLVMGWLAGRAGVTPFGPGRKIDGNVVIGAHRNYSGRRYVDLLCKDYAMPLYGTLHETCEAAIKKYRVAKLSR